MRVVVKIGEYDYAGVHYTLTRPPEQSRTINGPRKGMHPLEPFKLEGAERKKWQMIAQMLIGD